jgi:hypothetical protein
MGICELQCVSIDGDHYSACPGMVPLIQVVQVGLGTRGLWICDGDL